MREAHSSDARDAGDAGSAEEAAPGHDQQHGRGRWRGALSGILLTLGVLLIPVAIVLPFAAAALSDSEAVTAALAPLADDPAVQDAVGTTISAALAEQVDADAAVGAAFDTLTELGLSQLGREALRVFEAPAAEGIRSFAADTIARIVESDSFATVWREAVSLSHRSLVRALTGGEEGSTVRVDGDTVSLDLAPLVTSARANMLDSGVRIAALVPTDVSLKVELFTIEGFAQARSLSALAVAIGPWAPFAPVLLIAAGLWAARRRKRAVIVTALSVALVSVVILIALSVSRGSFTAVGALTPAALGAIFDAVVKPLRSDAVALIWCGAITAVVAASWGLITAGASRVVAWVRARRVG